MKAVTKLKIRRIWNGFVGISLILLFVTIDFLISASPCLIIKPVNMFENLVCLTLFLFIFVAVIIITVMVMAKKITPIIPSEDEIH